MNDITIIENTINKVTECVASLATSFSFKDSGNLHYFLDAEDIQTATYLFLSLHKYIVNLLERTKMVEAKYVFIPLSTSDTLCKDDGLSSTDATFYPNTIDNLIFVNDKVWYCFHGQQTNKIHATTHRESLYYFKESDMLPQSHYFPWHPSLKSTLPTLITIMMLIGLELKTATPIHQLILFTMVLASSRENPLSSGL